MSTDRFPYQRAAAYEALAAGDGLVVNVGCCTDPAHLKTCDPLRVVNCDLSAVDEQYDSSCDPPRVIGTRPNAADLLFDAARDRWPFDDGQAALVILGDILEHMKPEEIAATLAEARRVSRGLCVTVPEDHRDTTSNERADKHRRGHVHRTIVTRPLLEGLLAEAGWAVFDWQTVEYDDGTHWGQRTMGHHVRAS